MSLKILNSDYLYIIQLFNTNLRKLLVQKMTYYYQYTQSK